MSRPDPAAAAETPVRALLGPTNTGKTHRAIERMLEHRTGMIGLPLRLLAREVYDRVTAQVGQAAVALVTGEEKRIPAHPRYWICTVESMPMQQVVDFLAVDEVQLASHRQRGHVFTDRLLHARGAVETWFLGSGTIRALIKRLCPSAEFESRPRLSSLSDAGSVTLATLPARSVVVAFSATRVYELAERLRLKRGGAAVVIGALSPRARNAQVALFQSGEVDTLVATDAIGMGLNLDVDNVVFAELRKFDGKATRGLEDAELAQIAGRAGRHHRAGRFATLDPLLPLPPGTVRALEQHRFADDERVFWRNHELDTGSIAALNESLRVRPPVAFCKLADDAEDQRALTALGNMPEVVTLAQGSQRVGLLWEICQIPDFRQLPFDDHFKLQAAVYAQLCSQRGKLDRGFIEAQLARLEHVEGDLETLLDRMSAVRTWTYITSHAAWVDDPEAWQTRTHDLEDRLSDALHQQLVQRFVDGSARRSGRRTKAAPEAAGARGARSLAGQLAAQATALGLVAAAELTAPGGRGVDQAGATAADERWVESLIEAEHARFFVASDGRLSADGKPVGRLCRGGDRLRPEIVVAIDVRGGARLRLGRRLLAFARDLVAELLAPIHAIDTSALGPAGRGIVYQLEQSLGSVATSSTLTQLRDLRPAERRALLHAGVVLGHLAVFVPPLFSPDALRKRRALCAAELWPETDPPSPPAVGTAVLLRADAGGGGVAGRIYEALGYVPLRELVDPEIAVRADELEAIGAEIAGRGPSPHAVAKRLGVSDALAGALISGLRRSLRESGRRGSRR
jgi:ATP-dependent RNA helicase SUPV3L1/SUV3